MHVTVEALCVDNPYTMRKMRRETGETCCWWVYLREGDATYRVVIRSVEIFCGKPPLKQSHSCYAETKVHDTVTETADARANAFSIGSGWPCRDRQRGDPGSRPGRGSTRST